MKKRFLALFIATTMICCLFTACSNTNTTQENNVTEQENVKQETEIEYDENLALEALDAYKAYVNGKTDITYHFVEIQGVDVPICLINYTMEWNKEFAVYYNGEIVSVSGRYLTYAENGVVETEWFDDNYENDTTTYYEWKDGVFENVASYKIVNTENGGMEWVYYIGNEETDSEKYGEYLDKYNDVEWCSTSADSIFYFNDIQIAYESFMEKR